MTDTATWVAACKLNELPKEDVKRWDHGSKSFAVFRTADDRVFVTDDICTHEYAHISDGFVMGTTVECPRHAGCFDFRTGEALNPPACNRLKTYSAKVENGTVFVQIG
ncbi:MocE family 2Fe-2S type ferredoxin [Phyllobacterium chamaecytisi]|uniref:MocE family 2Fe-2S type ferredoxin n=1 Tax=Phyllobacterium chamaecytisi TaxID=2876082 RepID=UPI001CCABAE3|nr:MocE family 2Fe-2S type ferredoxin [Phyllobacterium sp. KW56]MBZ9603276.1 Rieske 2Fe-2S domain-containing protein [Phyllobacterium sp. KW56]